MFDQTHIHLRLLLVASLAGASLAGGLGCGGGDVALDAASLDAGSALEGGASRDQGVEDSADADQGSPEVGGLAPTIRTQPQDQTVTVGESATFVVAVDGEPLPTLKWQRSSNGRDFADIDSATSTSYATPPALASDDGQLFRVVATNPSGVAHSRPAALAVFVGAVLTPPVDVETIVGSTAAFTVTASGQPAPVLQWQRAEAANPSRFADIPGATAATYVTPVLVAGDDGARFRVRFSNRSADGSRSESGETPSATLTVINALTATQILASERWSLVLRPDRTVAGFGEYVGANGEYTSSSNVARRPVRMYPAILTDVIQITGRGTDFWALKGDGTVLHWGYAGYGSDGRGNDGNGSPGPISGQLFRTNQTPVAVLEQRVVFGAPTPYPVNDVCQIASGDRLLLLVRAQDASGSATSCAPGAKKTLWYTGILTVASHPPIAITASPVPRGELPDESSPDYSPIKAIHGWRNGASGTTLFLLVLENGRAFGLGANGGPFQSNAFSLPGHPPYGPPYAVSNGGPIELTSIWDTVNHPVRHAAIGWYSAFVVRDNGQVLSHGHARSGVLGNGAVDTPNAGPAPVLAETCAQLPCTSVLTGVTRVAADFGSRVLVVKDGRIYGWGAGESGVLGSAQNVVTFPVQVGTLSNVREVSLGSFHALALRADGAVFAWGSNSWGQIATAPDDGQNRETPSLVLLP